MDEQIQLEGTQSSKCHKEAMDELNTILEIEKNFPGVFAQTIVDSLRAASGGVHPIYFGIQASSNTRGLSLYQRSLNLDLKNFNQLYERENHETVGYLKKKQNNKLFKAKEEPLKDDYSNSMSALKSDIAKAEFIPKLSFEYPNQHLDMARSIYEALRETYKNKKSKPAAPKNFFLKEFTCNGFEELKHKNNPHLLEKIIVSNFEGLISQENMLIKDDFSYATLNWASKIFDMIAALDIQNAISGDKELEENQRIYDTFCCLYETYHHLMFVLLTYQHDQGKPLYSYDNYKEVMASIDTARLPECVQGMTEHIVTKSGMDAVTKALLSVQSLGADTASPDIKSICWGDGVEVVYYEIERIVHYFKTKLSIPTYISGISCARYSKNGPYYTDEIIDNVTKEGPCALILDSTVQLPNSNDDPIFKILNNHRIKQKLNNGGLVIFLTKSFQKFATLGTQKMHIGDLTVIGKKDSELVKNVLKTLHTKFDDLFTPNTWGAELQWMTHLLKYNAPDELDFLNECSKAFQYFTITKDNPNIKKIEQSFSMYLLNVREYNNERLVSNVLPKGMQSFGYPFSASNDYPEPFNLRVNLGLEPKSLLEQLSKAFNEGDARYGTAGGIWKKNSNKLFLERGYIEDLSKTVEQFAKYSTLGKDFGNSVSDRLYKAAQKIISKRLIKSLDEDMLIFWDFENFLEKTKLTKEEIASELQLLGEKLIDKSILNKLHGNDEILPIIKKEVKLRDYTYWAIRAVKSVFVKYENGRELLLENIEKKLKDLDEEIKEHNESEIKGILTRERLLTIKANLPEDIEGLQKIFEQLEGEVEKLENDTDILNKMIKFLEHLEDFKANKIIEKINPSDFFYSPTSYNLVRYEKEKKGGVPKFLAAYRLERVKKYEEALKLLTPGSPEHVELATKLNKLLKYVGSD